MGGEGGALWADQPTDVRRARRRSTAPRPNSATIAPQSRPPVGDCAGAAPVWGMATGATGSGVASATGVGGRLDAVAVAGGALTGGGGGSVAVAGAGAGAGAVLVGTTVGAPAVADGTAVAAANVADGATVAGATVSAAATVGGAAVALGAAVAGTAVSAAATVGGAAVALGAAGVSEGTVAGSATAADGDQTCTVPSAPADAIACPSGDHATLKRILLCPLYTPSVCPLAAFQMRARLSSPPETMRVPSGDHASP